MLGAACGEIMTMADEPKDVDRLGLRFGCVSSNYTEVIRRFWKLAPLHDVQVELDGRLHEYSARSAQGLWSCISSELELLDIKSMAKVVVPDGCPHLWGIAVRSERWGMPSRK